MIRNFLAFQVPFKEIVMHFQTLFICLSLLKAPRIDATYKITSLVPRRARDLHVRISRIDEMWSPYFSSFYFLKLSKVPVWCPPWRLRRT